MNRKIKASFIIGVLFCLFISMSAFAATVHYTYDNLNRLTKVEYDNGTVIKYTYDAAGNRLTSHVTTYAVVAQSYPVISTAVGDVVDPESVSDLAKDALGDILPGVDVSVESNVVSGILDINVAGTSFPIVVTGTGTAQPPEKAELESLNGGLSAQLVLTDGTTMQIAPMTADPQGLADLFTGLTIQFQPDNGMIILKDASNNSYAGMFGWNAGSSGAKTIDTFTSAGSYVQIVYTDGTVQALSPAVGSLQALLDLFNDVNVQFTIDHSTGVINLANDSSCWKPDYLIRPFSGTERGEYIENRDAHGIYFKKVVDINGDGLADVEMWTEIGKQVIWQVPCQ